MDNLAVPDEVGRPDGPPDAPPCYLAVELDYFQAEKRYWRLRRLESAVPAQLALKNVTLRKGRDTLCKVRQSGTCCAEREQPICTASRWQLMESLSGTAVSSTVAIVGSIWPKGPAQAGPATQAQWVAYEFFSSQIDQIGRGKMKKKVI